MSSAEVHQLLLDPEDVAAILHKVMAGPKDGPDDWYCIEYLGARPNVTIRLSAVVAFTRS